MKKSNSGMTIIEILISVGIIGMVLLFLFNMLIQVRKEDEENNVQSNFLINQSTFIRRIEEDIANYGLVGISECGNDFNDLITAAAYEEQAGHLCIRFEFRDGYIKDRIGYLLIYKYYTKYVRNEETNQFQYQEPKWMIKYSRGYYRSCGPNNSYDYWEETSYLGKEMPAEISLGEGAHAKFTGSIAANATNAATIILPIIDESGDHYDINLSFLYDASTEFYCRGGGTKGSIVDGYLKCECLGDCAGRNYNRGFSYTCDY